MRFLVSMALLTLAPAAAAQPDFANFEDPADDQIPSGQASAWADLRRGSMAETHEGVQFTLQVSALASTDPAHYDVLWLRVRGDEAKAIGVGAYQQAGTWTGFRVEATPTTACAARAQPLAPVGSVPVRAVPGEPGRVTWALPAAEFDLRRGDVFYAFCAFSYVRAPAASAVNSDFARTPPSQFGNLSFQVGVPQAVRIGAMEIREPLTFIDDESRGPKPTRGAHDIEAVQILADDRFVNTTVRLRSLNWAEMGAQWHLHIGLNEYHPQGPSERGEGLRALLLVRNESLRYATVDRTLRSADNETTMPWTLLVQHGAPGYARLAVPRSNWTLTTDPGGLNVFVFLTAGEEGERPDTLHFSPQRFFDLPTPGWLALAGVGLALFWRRQR